MIRRSAILVAALGLLGAVAATFLPTSPDGATCGTWVAPEWTEEKVEDLLADVRRLVRKDKQGEVTGEAVALAEGVKHSYEVCSDALGTRRTVTFVLVGLAVIVPLGLMFVGGGFRSSRAMATPDN